MTHPIRFDGGRSQAEYEVINHKGREEPVPFVTHIIRMVSPLMRSVHIIMNTSRSYSAYSELFLFP